jgi:hypothetical protein
MTGIPWQRWIWYGLVGLSLVAAAGLAALSSNRRGR